jgi:N-carbamoyl-L-amino-acid hydrolase
MSRPAINVERLLGRLAAFATIGATPAGGVNRQALSREDREARALLASLGHARGFSIHQDEIANLFIRRPGQDNMLPPFLIGSHLDSQPTGGRFDGTLGTLAALEVLEAMEEAGVETNRPVEVVAWTNEEGSRFSPGTMGSMAHRHGHVPETWASLTGSDGALFAEELAATLKALPNATPRPLGRPVAGFLELHIEQGPALEKEKIPVGVVTEVQGTRWLDVTITGQAAHAGTTELTYRRDPMAAAADAMHHLFGSVMPRDERARLTVGRVAAEPGSVNAIPGAISFSIDIRHPAEAMLDSLEKHVSDICSVSADAHGCTVEMKKLFAMAPARFSEGMVDILEGSAKRLGIPYKRMISGAFHDALHLSAIAPTAMIFVPCRNGLSHNEAEYVEPEHAVIGARLLLEATLAATSALDMLS